MPSKAILLREAATAYAERHGLHPCRVRAVSGKGGAFSIEIMRAGGRCEYPVMHATATACLRFFSSDLDAPAKKSNHDER